jgi:hypothetical protein
MGSTVRIAQVTEAERTIKQLSVIRIVAILDLALLVPLVIAALTHAERVVDFLGPAHGIGYLFLLFLCVRGVAQGRWGWWFPAIVAVTLGPPGSLYGEHRIRKQLDEQPASS